MLQDTHTLRRLLVFLVRQPKYLLGLYIFSCLFALASSIFMYLQVFRPSYLSPGLDNQAVPSDLLNLGIACGIIALMLHPRYRRRISLDGESHTLPVRQKLRLVGKYIAIVLLILLPLISLTLIVLTPGMPVWQNIAVDLQFASDGFTSIASILSFLQWARAESRLRPPTIERS